MKAQSTSSPFCSLISPNSVYDENNNNGYRFPSHKHRQQESLQHVLVRFENRTQVVSIPEQTECSINGNDNKDDIFNIGYIIRQKISDSTGWPIERLQITTKLYERNRNSNVRTLPSFCNVRVISCIVGGKGGFGTLLKGQSRQAGAKSTTNFSACRDLQGRRLQHINDKVQYTLWKEWNEKVEAGTATTEQMIEAMLLKSTPTGVNGWYLPSLPTWADVSAKKESLKSRRIFYNWKRQMKYNENLKNQQREEKQAQIDSYVRASEEVTDQITNTLQSAFQKGLQKQQQSKIQTTRKRSLQEMTSSKQLAEISNNNDITANETKEEFVDDDENQILNESSTSLVTLSGDFVIEYDAKSPTKLQSKSNFATVVVLVDPIKVLSNNASCYYYEVSLVTKGVVQIGWSILNMFKPNSETGDGVGDCRYSWSIDISRNIKLHNNKTESYEGKDTASNNQNSDDSEKKPDSTVATSVSEDKSVEAESSQSSENTTPTIVGCIWNVATSELSFSVNGNSWGIAFQIENKDALNDEPDGTENDAKVQMESQALCLYPTISCNENEIIELHWYESQFQYKPVDAVAIADIMVVENDVDPTSESMSNGPKDVSEDKLTSKDYNSGKNDQSSKIDQSDSPKDDSHQNIGETLEEFDLNQYNTVEELETLGLDYLKSVLQREGIKCGGTLRERAERLFVLKGLSPDEYPAKLRVTKRK